MIPRPTACPCCNGKLGEEDITETLKVIPWQWKVIQTVRERFACRACETISQSPAPFHPIAAPRRPVHRAWGEPIFKPGE